MSLLSAMDVGLSGMLAAQSQLNVAADNVANMDTPGFQSASANLAADPEGGVDVVSISTDSTDAGVDDEGEPLSNVDPAHELVQMHLSQTLYDANAMTITAADHMLGSLLDVMSEDNQTNK